MHLVGLGGVGMSALAQLLLDRGFRISGSDRSWDRGAPPLVMLQLAAQGVRLCPQDGSGVRHAGRVVFSSAIEPLNPDWRSAESLGVPIASRAALLAEQAPSERLIGVAGTSGKSTTTAMLGWVLASSGLDPVVVNGAGVPAWMAGNRVASVRKGRGDLWVLELDESDRSLLLFHPEHAILTNVSADHFPVAEARSLFDAFRKQVRGVTVDGFDIGLPPDGRLQANGCGCFTFDGMLFRVSMPGLHNVSNAWLAVRMALALGCDPASIAAALLRFPGLERRLQRVGWCGPAPVFDDYAHNPAKLAAVWATLRNSSKRVVGVWRPHGFGPLRAMLETLPDTLSTVCSPRDLFLVLPVYDAGGTADRSIDTAVLVRRLRQKGVPVEAIDSPEEAEAAMRLHAVPGTVLVTLGARDPALPRLAQSLASGGARSTATPAQRAPPTSASTRKTTD